MIHRLALLLAVLLAAPITASAETPKSDPRAIAIADQVMESLGGSARWNALPGLRWSFGAEVDDTVRAVRRHCWNKHTGWERVEGKTGSGQPFCFIVNLNDGKGMAWIDGQPIEGDSLQKLLKLAHRMWVNDSYWFLMPYKLRDPGVILQYDREAKEDGRTYDVIALSFDHVGDTPGDRYWVYVNRANHRVEKWQYLLQGEKPPPVAASWSDWEEHDGLWFCTAHRRDGRNTFTRDVETMDQFPPTEFTAP
jgi:hypothetical protein